MLCVLALAACTSKNGQTTAADALETKADTLEIAQKELPRFDYREFDIKGLAQILVDEKKIGESKDSVLDAFLKESGFENRGSGTYYKFYADSQVVIVASHFPELKDGEKHHAITIRFKVAHPEGPTQYSIVGLRQFGLRDIPNSETYPHMKGKGLSCIGHIGSMTIEY